MEITLTLQKLDYGDLAVRLLPLVGERLHRHENPAIRLLAGAAKLPPSLLRGTIDCLPQETKDQLAAFLINCYEDRVKTALTAFGEKQGVSFQITGLIIKP